MALLEKFKRLFLRENKIKDNEPKTQLEAFQKSMKLLLMIGKFVALNPSSGILETDVSKMRFSVCTWTFYYCIVIGAVQIVIMMFGLYAIIISTSMSVTALGKLVFYTSISINTLTFLHLATKWPGLMRELENCSLNEYLDRSIKFKCYATCVVILFLCFVEHVLFKCSKLKQGEDCSPNYTFDAYFRRMFDWYYALGLPANPPLFVSIEILSVISKINWNYTDMYIACISIYLVSILDQVNKKIILATEKHYLPTVKWRSLREDYNKATRLVRSFDDVISGVVFFSFTNNLFYICLHFFNILKIFGGYELAVYLVYSAVYLFVRSLVVSLIAANVHSASLVPATALYNVPSSSFCPEVARLINQVHTNTVALSGLQFFYITRELVLAVAGTIVTYELVLLQIGRNEIKS